MSAVVLVAEDDRDLQSLLSHALQADGHAVHLASDGRQALDGYRALAPDLMLLDLMMPRLSGFEVLAELRAAGELRREAPVLILTARTSENDVRAALDLGAADYVTKPFVIGELRARVSTLLARRS